MQNEALKWEYLPKIEEKDFLSMPEVKPPKDEGILWICGHNFSNPFNWGFQGIFDTEQKAINACLDYDWFIAPVEVNKKWSPDNQEWRGAYYPLADI